MQDPLSYKEFAAKIKTKYPSYKDMDDLDLAQRMVEKYPEYKSQVYFDDITDNVKKKDLTQPSTESSSVEESTVGQGDTGTGTTQSTDSQFDIPELIARPEQEADQVQLSQADRVASIAFETASLSSPTTPFVAEFTQAAYNTVKNVLPMFFEGSEIGALEKDINKIDDLLQAYKGKSDDTEVTYYVPSGGMSAPAKITTTVGELKKQRIDRLNRQSEKVKSAAQLEANSLEFIDPNISFTDGINPGELGNLIGGQLPIMAASIVAPVVGSYTMIYGDMYYDNVKSLAAKKFDIPVEDVTPSQMSAVLESGDDIEKGMTEELALAAASLDLIGLGTVFSGVKNAAVGVIKNQIKTSAKAGGKKAFKEGLKQGTNLLLAGVTEGSTEGGQNYLAQLSKAMTLDEELDADWNSILEEGAAGAIMGTLIPGMAGAISRKSRLNSRQVDQIIENGESGVLTELTSKGFINWDRINEDTKSKVTISEDKITINNAIQERETEKMDVGEPTKLSEEVEQEVQQETQITDEEITTEEQPMLEVVQTSGTQEQERAQSTELRTEEEVTQQADEGAIIDQQGQPDRVAEEGMEMGGETESDIDDVSQTINLQGRELTEVETEIKNDPVVYNSRKSLIEAFKEEKPEKATAKKLIKENIDYLKNKFVSELEELGISEVELNDAKKLVSLATKNKNITDNLLDKFDGFIKSIAQKSKVKRLVNDKKTVLNKLKTNKFAEASQRVERLAKTEVSPTSKYFNDYVQFMSNAAKKLSRGRITSDDIRELNMLEQEISQKRGTEELIDLLSEIQAVRGYENADQLIEDMNDLSREDFSGIQLSEEQANTVRKVFDSIESKAKKIREARPPEPPAGLEFGATVIKEGTKIYYESFVDGEFDQNLFEKKMSPILEKTGMDIETATKLVEQGVKRAGLIERTKSLKSNKKEILKKINGTEEEKKYISQILDSDNDLSNFENYEINLLNEVISGSDVFVSPNLRSLWLKVTGESNGRMLLNEIANFKELVDKLGTRVEPWMRRYGITEAVRASDSNMTPAAVAKRISKIKDRILGAQSLNDLSMIGKNVGKTLDKIISGIAGGLSAYQNERTLFTGRLSDSIRKIPVKERAKVNVLTAMFRMDKMYQSNLLSRKVFPIEELVKARKNKGRNSVHDDFFYKLFDEFSKDGKFDSKKAESYLKKVAPDYLKTIEESLAKSKKMALHNAKYSANEVFDDFFDYFPLMQTNRVTENISLNVFDSKAPSFKAGSSRRRQDYRNADGTYNYEAMADISLDSQGVISKMMSDQMKNFYLEDDFLAMEASLRYVESAAADDVTRTLAKALRLGFRERLQGQINTPYIDSKVLKVIRTIANKVKTSLINNPVVRGLAELPANMLLFVDDPKAQTENPTFSSDTHYKLSKEFKSIHAQRIATASKNPESKNSLGEYEAENLMAREAYASTYVSKTMSNPELKGFVLHFYDIMDKVFNAESKTIGRLNDKIIQLPDVYAFSRPHRNYFNREFKRITGKDFNEEAYLTDKNYSIENAKALRESMKFADAEMQRRLAGSKFHSQAVTKGSGVPQEIYNMINGFFRSFASGQSANMRNALNSLFNLNRMVLSRDEREFFKSGAGSMTKKEAIGVLTRQMLNMYAYQLIAQALVRPLISSVLTGDDLEDKMKEGAGRALKYAAMELALSLTPMGAMGSIAYTTSSLAAGIAFDLARNKKDWNSVERQLSYSGFYLRNYGGALGVAINAFVDLFGVGKDVVTGEQYLTDKKTVVPLAKNLFILGGVPGSQFLREIEKDIEKDKKNKSVLVPDFQIPKSTLDIKLVPD